MRNGWTGIAAAAAVSAWLGGCVRPGGGAAPLSADGAVERGPVPTAVLSQELLEDESGSLLDVMIRHIPALRVRPTELCPAISLRGPNTAPGITGPDVYVDGQRSADTCVLVSLPSVDVRRVEVYARGVSGRPGYGVNAHGLILVFRRNQ